MTVRIFTVDEARRAMPLVKRIAVDMQQVVNALAAIPGGVTYLYGVTGPDDLPLPQRTDAATLRNQLEELVEELSEIGVQLKGVQPVLIDFPSVRDGEDIFLCWAMGEDDLCHWHTPEGGFRGRQRL